ncbi:MAG TPA: hypothetical protein DCW41_03890 [Clostridiales bacterium]|nr:hypothetical protein [Clostridiales bacterium]
MDRMRNGIDYKISLLRIIATLSVVMLHVCSTLTDGVAVSWSSTFQFDVFALTQILLHWTIPVFLMITGFLLLGPEKSIGYDKVFRKYCSRIVGVLVIFGIPMAFIKIYSEGQGEISAMGSFGKALLAVLSNQGFAHFWYLYVLIGLYLVLPVIKAFTARASRKDLDILILILFIFTSLAPLLSSVLKIGIAFTVPFSYGVMYLLLGYRMRNIGKVVRIFPVSLFAFMAVLLIVLYKSPFWNGIYAVYGSPIVVLMAVSVFLFIMSFDVKGGNALWAADRLCFGVYIIHPLFIHIAYRGMGLVPTSKTAWPLAMILTFLAVAFLSFAATALLMLIKPLKKYVL